MTRQDPVAMMQMLEGAFEHHPLLVLRALRCMRKMPREYQNAAFRTEAFQDIGGRIYHMVEAWSAERGEDMRADLHTLLRPENLAAIASYARLAWLPQHISYFAPWTIEEE